MTSKMVESVSRKEKVVSQFFITNQSLIHFAPSAMLAGFSLVSSHEAGVCGHVAHPNLVDPLAPKIHIFGPIILCLAGYSLNLCDSGIWVNKIF